MAEQANQEEQELTAYEKLSNTQKCAILMMLLGEDEAAEILKNLGPKEVQQLGKEMYTVWSVYYHRHVFVAFSIQLLLA